MTGRIFDGLKVIDCASFIAAPVAATILGDFGADVTRACLATVAHLADPISSLVSVAEGEAPQRTRLLSNRPNPFNPSTTIRFTSLELTM